jgi:hypothetical protein
MGFDVTYHPMRQQSMQEWYFDRLAEARSGDWSGMTALAAQAGLNEQLVNMYRQILQAGVETNDNETFEKTHVYYMAAAQGLFADYFYTRGTLFSDLVARKPSMGKYVTAWEQVRPEGFANPCSGGLEENYSGGVYISSNQCKELLVDNEGDEQVHAILQDFFGGNLPVFLKAAKVAVGGGAGLVEASEIIEPDPFDLENTGGVTDINHCDPDGVMEYVRMAAEQVRAATQAG